MELEDFYQEEADGDEDSGAVEWFDEQGRRHVRRSAPEGTEEIREKEMARETALPDRMERWRQRSATGAVVTAFALGLQAALDTQRDEPAIVMETSDEPPTDLPVEAQLEQLGPRQSTVKVRTWLFAANGEEAAPGGGAQAPVAEASGPVGEAGGPAAKANGAPAPGGTAGEAEEGGAEGP